MTQPENRSIIPVSPYTGPEKVHVGQPYILIDPLLDEPTTSDSLQHQRHADQMVSAVKINSLTRMVQVEALDGARFWVPRRFLALA